jgi:hypothetical protein
MKSLGVSYTAKRKVGKKGTKGDDWLREGRSRADFVQVSEISNETGDAPRWLTRGGGDSVEIISDEESTAQV